jgi:hypothetical protein
VNDLEERLCRNGGRTGSTITILEVSNCKVAEKLGGVLAVFLDNEKFINPTLVFMNVIAI